MCFSKKMIKSVVKKKIHYDYSELSVPRQGNPSGLTLLCSGFYMIRVDHTLPMWIRYEYLKVPA